MREESRLNQIRGGLKSAHWLVDSLSFRPALAAFLSLRRRFYPAPKGCLHAPSPVRESGQSRAQFPRRYVKPTCATFMAWPAVSIVHPVPKAPVKYAR